LIRQEQIRADREFQIHLQHEQLQAAARQHELELGARVEAKALRCEQFQAQCHRDTVQEDRPNSIVGRANTTPDRPPDGPANYANFICHSKSLLLLLLAINSKLMHTVIYHTNGSFIIVES